MAAGMSESGYDIRAISANILLSEELIKIALLVWNQGLYSCPPVRKYLCGFRKIRRTIEAARRALPRCACGTWSETDRDVAKPGLGPQPLARIFGHEPKIAPENALLVGVRDIDIAERENLRHAGMTEVYTMRDIDERGMRAVMEEALRAAATPPATTFRWTWTGSIPRKHLGWAHPCEGAPNIARPIQRWRSFPTMVACSALRLSK